MSVSDFPFKLLDTAAERFHPALGLEEWEVAHLVKRGLIVLPNGSTSAMRGDFYHKDRLCTKHRGFDEQGKHE